MPFRNYLFLHGLIIGRKTRTLYGSFQCGSIAKIEAKGSASLFKEIQYWCWRTCECSPPRGEHRHQAITWKNTKCLTCLVILCVLDRMVKSSSNHSRCAGTCAGKSLSGHVNIRLERREEASRSNLCRPDWETVLSSTKMDDKGYFSLEEPPGNLFYLRFSSPGVNPFQVKVRINKDARHDMSIHLNIAT